MNTRERFGNYLLLKKLTEDPLGETFRAGLLGAKGMERVVLLRVFNGQGLDGPRLWEASRQRTEIQQALRSPNIGEGVDMGEIQGLPYVAYDYVSGKNLATLFDQAASRRTPIPSEHALLITERVALGLVVAAENRLGGERILHGFLAPHLVMISNEGESRLLGFEVAPGLRSFAAANPVVRQHFGRYLAPEALSGAAPHRGDDIYSLGVLLFELLTGQPLPSPAADGFGSLIDQATQAVDGSPIPGELAQLLKQTLVAREQRIGDVVTWHKTLNKWMFEGQYNPTTFNLAFFMHNLFRQDIERESQEIEVEKTLPLPVTAPAPTAAAPPPAATPPSAAVPVAPPPPPASAPVATATGSGQVKETTAAVAVAAPQRGDEQPSSRKGLIAAVLAVVLLAAAGGGWWWLSQQGGDGADAADNTAADQTATAAEPLPDPALDPLLPADGDTAAGGEAVPDAPSEEEQAQLQAQIDQLVNQKASDMEEQLRGQMDAQLEALRKQLETAQKAADEREALLQQQREAEAEAERQRLADEEAERLRQEEEARLAEEAAQKAAEEEAARLAAERAAAPPPPPAVRRGDLVEPGPGVIGPKLQRIPAVRFPEMARRLNRGGVTVSVRVLVDENGRVLEAELEGEKAGYGFDTEALSVAKKALYTPAKAGNVPVKMWVTLHVQFE